MNKEYVLVPKEEFDDIITNYLVMLAGISGGVDNWQWWDESINNFIDMYNEGNGTHFTDMDEVIEDYIKAFKTTKIEGE